MMKYSELFYLFVRLARIDSPAGYLLLFFPALFGLLLADDISNIVLFFIGSVIARSAGCIINDIFDKKFDKSVERTKLRPLASGEVSIKFAIIELLICAILGLSILFSLSSVAIYIGLIGIVMIMIYPVMKRYTDFPQIFLGFTFNLGVLIGYASVLDALSYRAIVMYVACCLWTIGYDTIYGFADIKDDKVAGIRSMAIFLEDRDYKLFLQIVYGMFILLFVLADAKDFWGFKPFYLILASLLLYRQVVNLDIQDPQNCLSNFKSNVYVGLVLALYMFY